MHEPCRSHGATRPCSYLKSEHMPGTALQDWFQKGLYATASSNSSSPADQGWEVPVSCETRLPGYVFLLGAADDAREATYAQLQLYPRASTDGHHSSSWSDSSSSSSSSNSGFGMSAVQRLAAICSLDPACTAFSSQGRLLYRWVSSALQSCALTMPILLDPCLPSDLQGFCTQLLTCHPVLLHLLLLTQPT